jgi:sporulation protein YlmC with PRC-barrel domain
LANNEVIIMSYLNRDTYGMYKSVNKRGPGPALMGAHTLVGEDVVNGQNEALGDIKEIMLDMSTGKVAYAVLSFGGVFGIGEKLFAVPWTALTLDTINKNFVLNISKEQLKNAPGFDKDDWPDMNDATWAGRVNSFYRDSSFANERPH